MSVSATVLSRARQFTVAYPSFSGGSALPAGFALRFDPTPANLRDGSGVPLDADTSYGVAVADIYDGATLIASQTTGTFRAKWLGPNSAGLGHLHLPGVAGNYASLAASADDDFGTGDFILTVRLLGLSLAAGTKTLVMNRSGGTGFDFQVNTATPRLVINGATIHTATAALGSAPNWIRVRRVSTVLKFETSPDGTTWTQLGTDVTVTASPTASAGALQIGQYTSGQNLNARVYSVVINKAGSNVISIDFTNPSVAHGALSFVCSTGQTVTINKTGSDPAALIRANVLCFDGVDDVYSLTSTLATANDMTFISSMLRSGTQMIDLGTSVAAAQPYGFYLTAAALFCPCSSIYVSQLTEADPTTFRVMSLIQTATSKLALNGVDKPAVTHGSRSNVNAFNYIGGRGTDRSGGMLGRFVVYTSVLSATQVTAAERWAATGTGITI